MKKLIIALIILLPFSITCYNKEYKLGNDVRSEYKSKYGSPEEVNTYSSSTYWSETWWYWTKGYSFTFVAKARTEDKGCGDKTIYTDVVLESTYTFKPITTLPLTKKNIEISKHPIILNNLSVLGSY